MLDRRQRDIDDAHVHGRHENGQAGGNHEPPLIPMPVGLRYQFFATISSLGHGEVSLVSMGLGPAYCEDPTNAAAVPSRPLWPAHLFWCTETIAASLSISTRGGSCQRVAGVGAPG